MIDMDKGFKDHIIDVLEGDSREEYEEAILRVHEAITTPPGVNFLAEYARSSSHRAEHGAYPENLPPRVLAAIEAVDSLKDKRVASLLQDPSTSQWMGGAVDEISASFLITATPANVLNEVMTRHAARQASATQTAPALSTDMNDIKRENAEA